MGRQQPLPQRVGLPAGAAVELTRRHHISRGRKGDPGATPESCDRKLRWQWEMRLPGVKEESRFVPGESIQDSFRACGKDDLIILCGQIGYVASPSGGARFADRGAGETPHNARNLSGVFRLHRPNPLRGVSGGALQIESVELNRSATAHLSYGLSMPGPFLLASLYLHPPPANAFPSHLPPLLHRPFCPDLVPYPWHQMHNPNTHPACHAHGAHGERPSRPLSRYLPTTTPSPPHDVSMTTPSRCSPAACGRGLTSTTTHD